jgi:hypothetical protein
MPNEWYSAPMPRTKPEMILPPEMTSSMATSSATRSGWSRSGSALPKMAIWQVVRGMSTAAITFGAGISPYADWWCSLTQTPSNPAWSYATSSSRYRW